MSTRQPQGIQASTVAREILGTDCRHHERLTAQHAQRMGDVARTTAELAPQIGHEKRDIQDVDLVGQDVMLEAVVEHHDGVVRDGSADQGVHGCAYELVGFLGVSWFSGS